MTTTKPAGAGRGSLPTEMTSFVGRRRELGETRRLLASSRMLTLTGVGGVGKTRLALRMAAEVRRTFPHGVWFVELASLRDPMLLPHTVANTLELRQVSADPATDLAAYLEDQQLLVVLDNCEHLTEAVAVLASKLLAASPGLRILATSRHVLGVEGEQILTVPPLSTPEGEVPAGDATHYESVKLFVDRASAVAPDFEITEANRAVVVELCQKLDGIPLAIELAAVWLRILTPRQILHRLEDRFRLLATDRPAVPSRQQALDATVGWSYDLCSPAEQQMWARLSVFSGGFDLDAAEDVCSGEEIPRAEVLNLVASLVNKSIIVRHQATDHTTAWYEILEIVRQYGAERLGERDQTHQWRVRHREHYRALAARFAAEGFGPQQEQWFMQLRRETRNLRAALEFCLEDPAQAVAAFDIAAPLWNFWIGGFVREGYLFLSRALDLAPERTPARAHALWAASYLAMYADFERSAILLAECEEIAAGLDDGLLNARIKECRGHATLYQGDLKGAIETLEEALGEFRAVGNPLGEFDSLILLAACRFFLHDPRTGEFAHQALALTERHGARSSMGYGNRSVGLSHLLSGDFEKATRSLQTSVRLFQPMNDLTGISFGVQGLSWCAASASPDERAARLLGAAHAVWRTSGAKVDETNAYTVYDRQAETGVRAAVGDARYKRAFAEGAAFSYDQAVSYALGEDADAADRVAPPAETVTSRPAIPSAGGLTPREAEIAGLLAQGLTNKEISARLVISQRTVETHVDHILGKLSMTSRAQVASWVAEHRAQ